MNREQERLLYPDTWLREQRGGYGFIQRVPCRVLTQTAARIKIVVPRADGDPPVVRYVTREKIIRAPAALPGTGTDRTE